MKKLNILHISDIHIQKKDEKEICEIVQKLISDVQKFQEKKEMYIDLICFTGDLIQQGDKAIEDENQWELANDIFLKPLVKALGLSEDRIVLVPGNHEVNRNEIIPALESGLQKKTLQEINDIMANFHESYTYRLKYFYDIIKENQSNIQFGKVGYVYKKQINELDIGIACVDSAWRSSGKGMIERGSLYIGVLQIQELYNMIDNCNIKICMMHHPLNWIEECEMAEIEKELGKFDVVLNGHVHEENLKQIIKNNLNTIYCTAGKIYPLDYANGRAVDGYNGYSILNLDLEGGKLNAYIRSYYAQNRHEFDDGINICPNGVESYYLFAKDDNCKLEHDIIKGISKFFNNMSERYSLISMIDTQSPKNHLQTWVEPVLSFKSEYVKEDIKDIDEEINIQKVVEIDDNILFVGKKESGKTTVLQQIGLNYITNYDSLKMIPIYIDMKYLPKGKDKLFNCAFQFVVENLMDETLFSRQKIKEFLNEGRIVFLLDNVETNNVEHTISITKLHNDYCKNRLIITVEEEFFQSIDIKEIPEYGTEFKEIYIQNMGRSQIRAMVTQWAKGKENVNIDDAVNKIDLYCNHINLAKTPFNIAVFMVLWDNDNNFIPVNEGIVMENYLEIILEKISPKESYGCTYSFKLKRNFLSFLAYNMYLKNEFYLTYEDYIKIVEDYHKQKGFNLKESRFDIIFLEKNILSYSGEYIVFSHTSFLEYFLAVYAYDNHDFLEEITSYGKRINFQNEICFYAGLNQNCKELLNSLSETILNTVVNYIDLIEELNEIEIMTEFKIDKEKFIEDIKKNRPTQEEIDAVSDRVIKNEEKNPTELNKRVIDENIAEDFYSLLTMYGSVIKNAELLDNSDKIMHLEYYMYGMNMLYAMMIKLFEYINEEITLDKLSDYKNEIFSQYTEEEFADIKKQMIEVTKLLFPIAIQNMILENIGTPKLEVAINELIKDKHDKPFEKFMLVFLKCDLKIVDLKHELNSYIVEENSKGILKLMLMKLIFYYKMRFYGIDLRIDKDLMDLITNIHIKLNPSLKSGYRQKSLITKTIKEKLDR